MSELVALEKRLLAATKGEHKLDQEIFDALVENNTCEYIGLQRYTQSVDAALWLCERLIPEWTLAECRFNRNDDKTWHAELREGHLTSYSSVVIAGGYKYNSGLPTPGIAICLALVRALIMKQAKATASAEGEK